MINKKLVKFAKETMDTLTVDELFDALKNGLIRGDWTEDELRDIHLESIDVEELIKEATMMYNDCIHNLFCAVLLQAVKDYFGETSKTTRRTMNSKYFHKPTILKALRDDWLVSVTDGLSLTVADQLETNGAQIKMNIKHMVEDYELIKVNQYDNRLYD